MLLVLLAPRVACPTRGLSRLAILDPRSGRSITSPALCIPHWVFLDAFPPPPPSSVFPSLHSRAPASLALPGAASSVASTVAATRVGRHVLARARDTTDLGAYDPSRRLGVSCLGASGALEVPRAHRPRDALADFYPFSSPFIPCLRL